MPNINSIQNLTQLFNHFTCKIEAKPKYSGLKTNSTANFSNSTGYMLQLQASTQLKMLRLLLDHIPNAITTV